MKWITRILAFAWMIWSLYLMVIVIKGSKGLTLDVIFSDPMARFSALLLCLFILAMVTIFAGGLAVLRYKSWGRVVLIVSSTICLLLMPAQYPKNSMLTLLVILLFLFSLIWLIRENTSDWNKATINHHEVP